MAIIRCPECGHEISDKAPYCPACGVAIAGKVITCPECGTTYFSELAECPHCHHRTPLVLKTADEAGENEIAGQQIESATSGSVDQSSHTQAQPVSSSQPASQAKPVRQSTSTVGNQGLYGNQSVGNNLSSENSAVEEFVEKEERTSSRRNNRIIISIVAIAAIVVGGICYWFYHGAQTARENDAYELAMMSKDPDVLQRYLDQYLDAPEEHRDSIQAHLDMLKQVDQAWTDAIVSGSKSALQQYIEQNPNSPYKQLAIHKIDSIDWSTANAANSVEAIEAYIEMHPDGEHIDDANNMIKSINAKTLQPEEKQMVSGIFQSFFQSLNNHDEDALTSVVSPLLTSFLGKSNATRSDVVTFMHKIYKDVASMSWRAVGDYTINKKEIGNQQYEYTVSVLADQNVNHEDNTTSDTKYRISAKVSPDGRISELNMVKIIE